jgi:hypothetical protein
VTKQNYSVLLPHYFDTYFALHESIFLCSVQNRKMETLYING